MHLIKEKVQIFFAEEFLINKCRRIERNKEIALSTLQESLLQVKPTYEG